MSDVIFDGGIFDPDIFGETGPALPTAISLGGYVLAPEAATFLEEDMAEATIQDLWLSATFQRYVTIFRKGKTWFLHCYEQNVDWASSVAQALETAMCLGSLAFVIDKGVLHQVDVNVYVKSLSITYDGRVRLFDLELQQKED